MPSTGIRSAGSTRSWTWTTIDEYLLGDRILVAPVQEQGATSRAVHLPAGTWYPLFGGAAASGELVADAPLAEIPAYVPAGAMLVLYPDGVATVLGAPVLDREVWLYPGTATDPAHARWDDELGAAGASTGRGVDVRMVRCPRVPRSTTHRS